MSGRRRKEVPPGGSPGDGKPNPAARTGRETSGDDRNPFAPRPPDQGGYGDPSSTQPSYGYRNERRDSLDYGEGGGYFGRQSGANREGGGYVGGQTGGRGSEGHGGGGYGAGAYGAGGYGAGRYGEGPGDPRRAGVSQSGGGQGSGGPGGGGHGSGGHGSGPGGQDGGDGRRRAVRRRTIGTLIGPLAGAVGLAILLGAGVYALADSRGCGGNAVDLAVAAAPEIAPAMNDIAASFTKERHSVDGRCVKVTVRASDPAGMSTVLSGQGSVPGENTPDVWVPDSSMWVTLVHSSPKGASSTRMTSTSVARTPILVATSRGFAAKMQSQGIRPTWDMLLKATDALSAGAVTKNDMLPANSVHLQILDPIRNAGGLGAVIMTHALLQGDPNANAIFTQIVRNVQNSLSPNRQALFASFHRDLNGKAPVVIVPEQAVWAYNHQRPATPASAVYPSEGMLSLDYPFALTTGDDAKVRAANLLERTINTAQARGAVQALGFRTPDGHLGSGSVSASGLSPRIPRALPAPAPSDVTDVVQAWTKLSLRTRMLTLLDVSGSMGQQVGKGVTRMQATAQVAQGGLAMLADDTDLGLWTFSTNLQGTKPYRTEVPLGPLSTRLGSGTRRQAILAALGRVRPKPDGNTGLYDSVLAAVRSLRQTYKAGYYNSLLVLTDGKNDDTGGISLSTLLRTIRKETDPDRPVMVIFIGFGPDVDLAAMQKISVETNGVAYQAMKPQDVKRILLEAIARRICSPQCH